MAQKGRRALAVVGLIFVVLVVVSIGVTTGPESTHHSAAKVVAHYANKTGQLWADVVITEAAILVGLVFFWFLRDLLPDRPLATLGFVGAVVFAMSGAVAAGIEWTLADTVKHVDPSVVQTLNALNSDLTNVMMGAGGALFLLATGIAIVRAGGFPRWLGWAGVVLGVLALPIFFIGFFGTTLWVLAASVILLTRSDATGPAGRTTAPLAEPDLRSPVTESR
jgi:hypothetical protein